METWYLIIILGSGGFKTGTSQQTIPFKTEQACLIAKEPISQRYFNPRKAIEHSDNIVICVKDQ